MLSGLTTYRKFIYKDDALELIEVLEKNQVDYELVDNSSRLDSSFGGDINTKQFEVKVPQDDFERVEKLEEELVKNLAENVDKDYYLFEYSNDELIEIVLKKEEWSKFDYLVAQKILKERGISIQPEVLNAINKQRAKDLAVQEVTPTWLIVIGYIAAILGGFLGIFVGAYLFFYKKALPNGEKIYGFGKKDRMHGQNILFLSLIAIIVWFVLRNF